MATISAVPAPLRAMMGRISDLDSHEMMPLEQWVESFGADFDRTVENWLAYGESEKTNLNHPSVPDYPGDIAAIDGDIGLFKGCRAPGASDMTRRDGVMDALGIHRQLMFAGSAGHTGLMLQLNETDLSLFASIRQDRKAYGQRILGLYNDWMVRVAQLSDRIRPVALVHAETVETLIDMTRSLIDRGIRAIQIPAGKLPGGKSPAHAALDPYWAMLSEADCVVTLHIGGEGQFFETRGWGDAPVFENFRNLGEFTVDPWTLSTFHLACQNFTSTMIVGGVFDRHPGLRFGVIEVGAYWVGPMIEGLDMWYENAGLFKSPGTYRLPEKPSFYLRRNVRVTPFAFEDVARMIRLYGLDEVLCFSSDYPHVEGGRNALEKFYENIAALGDGVIERFFVTNGQLLLPD